MGIGVSVAGAGMGNVAGLVAVSVAGAADDASWPGRQAINKSKGASRAARMIYDLAGDAAIRQSSGGDFFGAFRRPRHQPIARMCRYQADFKANLTPSSNSCSVSSISSSL